LNWGADNKQAPAWLRDFSRDTILEAHRLEEIVMAEEEKPVSCTSPVRGPILTDAPPATVTDSIQPEVPRMIARVGKKAPDFEAMAHVDGGFKPIKLSDYAGKWVLVCFYPGDFTFV
jgi:hypothetical protein